MVGLITLAALVLPAVDAADLGVSLRGVEVCFGSVFETPNARTLIHGYTAPAMVE